MKKKKGTLKIILIIVAVILILFVIVKILFDVKKESSNKNYSIISVVEKTGGGSFESIGMVSPTDIKGVFVDKPLKVRKVLFKEGDYVEKDELVIIFDDTSKHKTLRELESKKIEASTLRRNLNIENELLKIGGSSKNLVQDLRNDIRKLELIIADLNEEMSKTATELRSPVSGTITKLKAQDNYLVDTNNPLFEIADLSDLKVLLDIAEYNLQHIKMDLEIILKPEIYEGTKEFKGKVTRISKLSHISDSTGENVVEVEVTPNEEIPLLTAGFKVYGVINIAEEKEKLFIPKTSLIFENEEYYVFKVVDSKALKTKVEIENVSGGDIPVKSGLQKADKIIYNPNADIKDGEEIRGKEVNPENIEIKE